jgi:chemotaxis protein MotB
VIVGNRLRFAAELALDPEYHREPDLEWMFGYFSFWCGGRRVGNFEVVNSLRDIIALLQQAVGEAPHRANPRFAGLPAEAAWRVLNDGLFGGEDHRNVELARQVGLPAPAQASSTPSWRRRSSSSPSFSDRPAVNNHEVVPFGAPRRRDTNRRMTKLIAAVLVAATATAGCVSNGTYNKKVAEMQKARDDDDAAAKTRQDDLQKQIADTKASLDKETADAATLQKQIDDQAQLIATMQDKLKQLGQNVDSLTKEKGALSQSVTDANARLEELKKAKAAADARLAAFRTLLGKLKQMIDNGQLKVVIRDGRMIIALPSDILFESGRTDVKPAGKAALAAVAKALQGVPDRNFIVAGHTDDVPIKTAQFPSNWELSTARAVEVVHYLITQGMNPKVLAAAGYGEFDPVIANDSPEHRTQNRRIEIVLQPNLSDLPPLDDLTAPPKK